MQAWNIQCAKDRVEHTIAVVSVLCRGFMIYIMFHLVSFDVLLMMMIL